MFGSLKKHRKNKKELELKNAHILLYSPHHMNGLVQHRLLAGSISEPCWTSDHTIPEFHMSPSKVDVPVVDKRLRKFSQAKKKQKMNVKIKRWKKCS